MTFEDAALRVPGRIAEDVVDAPLTPINDLDGVCLPAAFNTLVIILLNLLPSLMKWVSVSGRVVLCTHYVLALCRLDPSA